MAAERAGGSELAQLVTDHVFLDIHGNVLAAVMDGLYDRIGAEEVRLALRLRDGFRARGWTFLVESPSNQQFPILPDALIERLKPEFSCSHTQSFPNGTSAVRFCTSWATTDADIDALLDAVPINA